MNFASLRIATWVRRDWLSGSRGGLNSRSAAAFMLTISFMLSTTMMGLGTFRSTRSSRSRSIRISWSTDWSRWMFAESSWVTCRRSVTFLRTETVPFEPIR